MSSSEILTPSQLNSISIIERVCSVFSLLGSLFVIGTFVSSKAFHKPINRLVFYASFGNMMTNVGTLMSRQYLSSPHSVGCQFQAFLIQMFMPADAFWTLSMAINVYLTFYFKFDARRLRKMEIPYLVGCYGIPFIPAFVYIFIKNREGERMYGDATLWCWVSPEWDIWRIITFYGPIWVVIAITFFIYIRAGHTIYRKRRDLDNFSSTDQDLTSLGDALATIKTTEVSVTTEVMTPNAIHLQPMGRRAPDVNSPQDTNGAYSVTISADAGSGDIADVVLPDPAAADADQHAGAPRSAQPSSTTKSRSSTTQHGNTPSVPSSSSRPSLSPGFRRAPTVCMLCSTPSTRQCRSEFMSAFVLPLQGFWNALIYMVTSWGACKSLLSDLRMGRRPDVTELVGGMAPEIGVHHHHHHRHNLSQFRANTRSNKYETESMTELANESRPNSDDGRAR
ncbi:hypothetical protein NW754_008389 [Fusarium falciforme]|nr:hypothetical protein NW754_008389 [Fusarium falciforme]